MCLLPKVSIITPAYNVESSISSTIISVINQSYCEWELLIIDDCSTDKTQSIIKEFSIKDKRIRYFKTDAPSGSPSLPRNIGIDNARGKFIAFLDADDLWLPNKLECQIKFMEHNNVKFLYSDYEKIDFMGNRNNRIIRMPSVSTFWDVIETCTIPCLTVIITKEIIGETRFKYIAKEDLAFWLDILKKNVKAHNTCEVLALYREHQNSRSSNKIKMIHDQWHLLREIEGVKPIVAFYFMFKYIIFGFLKYIR